MDDLGRAFDGGWFELIWFFDLSHFRCHTGVYPPFRLRFVDLPLICMITIGFEIHIELMIRFHCVLILRGASLESLGLIHIFWYSHDSWRELFQVRGFPLHPFSGVHVRSFVYPHGGTLELSGQIRYIRCHTGAYFPHLAKEEIVLSQILHSFHPSAGIYYICLTNRYSCDFRRDEFSMEHDVRVWIAPLARAIQ